MSLVAALLGDVYRLPAKAATWSYLAANQCPIQLWPTHIQDPYCWTTFFQQRFRSRKDGENIDSSILR